MKKLLRVAAQHMRRDVRRRHLRLLQIPIGVGVVLLACADVPLAPVGLHVSIAPTIVWSGGLGSLRSEQFRLVELEPRSEPNGSIIENQWSNFSIVVGGDTADSWRSGPDKINFRIPALYSGRQSVLISTAGFLDATQTVQVVGAEAPVWFPLSAITATYQVLDLGRGKVLLDDLGVLKILDLRKRESLPLFPEETRSSLQLPGPSYRRGSAVIGNQGFDPGRLAVWNIEPLVEETLLTCIGGRDSFGAPIPDTAAELAGGGCLSLDWRGIVAWGDSVIFEDFALTGGRFELAPTGEWGVITTLHCCDFSARGRSLNAGWPVFTNTGRIAYSVEYDAVSGVSFSENSDTLFVLAGVGDPPAESRSWTLDVLETETGTKYRSASLEPDLLPSAILLDPLGERIFVAATKGGSGQTVLLILERRTMDLIVEVPVPFEFSASNEGGKLMFGGSTGQLYFVKTACCDVGGINVFTFDTM